MSDVNVAVRALPPRINALQSAWLREIGVPRNFAQRSVTPPQALQGHTSPNTESGLTLDGSGAGHAASPSAVPANSSAGTPQQAERPVAPVRPSAAAKTAASKPPSAERTGTHDMALLQSADFDGLRALVTDCEVCKLCHTRAHAVFGAGVQGAEWMIVGEAPGEQEDAQAEPFVGKSGQLLTQMLQAVGVDRERDVFITNIVKCRPPGNRNPEVEEIEACKPYLLRQIDLVAPRRILVLGRFAAQVLLGSDASLASLRGRMHNFTDASQRKIPLVVSYHPAYLLRSPFEKARTWQDLHLAMSARRSDD